MRTRFALLVLLGALLPAASWAEVFDFDSAPIHAPLPIDQTVGAITAHFSATGEGFSIQPANEMGFTPIGFGGLCIYPSGINASDLLIGFNVALSDFSILYAPQELGCDDSAIMRVTAYLGGVLVGTATTTASPPGTWPTGTLSFGSPLGFDQVVVHYDQPPLCTDHGPIFMADNMTVTQASVIAVPPGFAGPSSVVLAPNPFVAMTTVRVQLVREGPLAITIHDASGRHVRTLFSAALAGAGTTSVSWNGRDEAGVEAPSGTYFCRVASAAGMQVVRVIRTR